MKAWKPVSCSGERVDKVVSCSGERVDKVVSDSFDICAAWPSPLTSCWVWAAATWLELSSYCSRGTHSYNINCAAWDAVTWGSSDPSCIIWTVSISWSLPLLVDTMYPDIMMSDKERCVNSVKGHNAQFWPEFFTTYLVGFLLPYEFILGSSQVMNHKDHEP